MIYPHQYSLITPQTSELYLKLLNATKEVLLHHLELNEPTDYKMEHDILMALRFTKQALEHARKIQKERDNEHI